VLPGRETPEGIRVDSGEQEVALERFDRMVDQVERCLRETFGDRPSIPAEMREAGQCLDGTFALPVDRSCLVVKVPDDWEVACDGLEQVLPAHAPDALCRAKGLEPTAACPCRWRAGIQDQHVIVVPPSARMFKDPLVRLATGCNNPWGHPALARCAAPDDP